MNCPRHIGRPRPAAARTTTTVRGPRQRDSEGNDGGADESSHRNRGEAPDPLAAGPSQVAFVADQALVVSRSLLRVPEQLVGRAGLLELLLTGRIASIEVRMVRLGGL